MIIVCCGDLVVYVVVYAPIHHDAVVFYFSYLVDGPVLSTGADKGDGVRDLALVAKNLVLVDV